MLDTRAYKDRVYIEDIAKYVGKEVVIAGWLYNKRSSGKIQFLLVRDGTNIIQCVVVKNEVAEEIFSLYDELGLESSLLVKGQVREDKRSPLGYELQVTDMRVLQVAQDYPITSHRSEL